MAITYRSSAYTSNAGSSTVVITKPTGTASGDVLVAIINTNASGDTITPPSGWVAILNFTSPMTANIATFYKVCGGSEPADYTFTLSASQRNSGGMTCFTGVDNSTPINVSNGQGNTSTLDAPSVTTTVDGCMLIYADAYDNGTTETYTEPSGYTMAYQSAGAAGNMQAYKEQTTAGSTGTVAATVTATYANGAFNIALQPAGAGGSEEVKTVKGVTLASVKTVNGITIANTKTILGKTTT